MPKLRVDLAQAAELDELHQALNNLITGVAGNKVYVIGMLRNLRDSAGLLGSYLGLVGFAGSVGFVTVFRVYKSLGFGGSVGSTGRSGLLGFQDFVSRLMRLTRTGFAGFRSFRVEGLACSSGVESLEKDDEGLKLGSLR